MILRSTEHLRSGPFVRFIYLFIFSCLICSLSWFSVVLEIQSLVTVLQHVFRNPFILVMSALRCHCCYGSVEASKINLKPLIFIVFFSWPGPTFAFCRIVKSASVCFVIRTQLWRGTDLIIANTIVFHSQIICTFEMYQLNACTVNFGLDLDFAYWILDSCQWNLDSGFQSLVGFRFRWALIPKPRIPLAKHIPGSVIQISLHGALKYDFTERNNLWADGVGFLKIEGKADRTAKGW